MRFRMRRKTLPRSAHQGPAPSLSHPFKCSRRHKTAHELYEYTQSGRMIPSEVNAMSLFTSISVSSYTINIWSPFKVQPMHAMLSEAQIR
jgi:hypothetical protein